MIGAAIIPDALVATELAEVIWQRDKVSTQAEFEAAGTSVSIDEHLLVQAKETVAPYHDNVLEASTQASSDVESDDASQCSTVGPLPVSWCSSTNSKGQPFSRMQNQKANHSKVLPIAFDLHHLADSQPEPKVFVPGPEKRMDMMFKHQDHVTGGRIPGGSELLSKRHCQEIEHDQQTQGDFAPSLSKVNLDRALDAQEGAENNERVTKTLVESFEEPVKKRKAKKAQTKRPQKEHAEPELPKKRQVQRSGVSGTPAIVEHIATATSSTTVIEDGVKHVTAEEQTSDSPSNRSQLCSTNEVHATAEGGHAISNADSSSTHASTSMSDGPAEILQNIEIAKPAEKDRQVEKQGDEGEWFTVSKMRGKKRLLIPQVGEKTIPPTTTNADKNTTEKLNQCKKQEGEKHIGQDSTAKPSNGTPDIFSLSSGSSKVKLKWSEMYSDTESETELSRSPLGKHFHAAAKLTTDYPVGDASQISEANHSKVKAVESLPQTHFQVVKALTHETPKPEKRQTACETLHQRPDDGETLHLKPLKKRGDVAKMRNNIQQLCQTAIECKALTELKKSLPKEESCDECSKSVSEPESEFNPDVAPFVSIENASGMQVHDFGEMQIHSAGTSVVEPMGMPQMADETWQVMTWVWDVYGHKSVSNGHAMLYFSPGVWETEEAVWANCAMVTIPLPRLQNFQQQQIADDTETSQWDSTLGMVPVQVPAPRTLMRSEVRVQVGFESVPLCLRGLQSSHATSAINPVIQVLLGVQPLLQLLVSLPPQCPELRPTLRSLSCMCDYFHQPAAPAVRAPLLDAREILRPILEACRQHKRMDLQNPATFLKFLLRRLHEETVWGPEEFPFQDPANMLCSFVEGSALRNIFGGTQLVSCNAAGQCRLQPFEILQIDALYNYIDSANQGTSQVDWVCGAPPVLVVQYNMHGHVNYGLGLSLPTMSPAGEIAGVQYTLMAAVFRVPNAKRGTFYAIVRHGQAWWCFKDAVLERARAQDVVARQQDIEVAIYTRQDCSSISVHPPWHDAVEFWMATSQEC